MFNQILYYLNKRQRLNNLQNDLKKSSIYNRTVNMINKDSKEDINYKIEQPFESFSHNYIDNRE